MNIQVIDSNKNWITEYTKEAAHIKAVLGNTLVSCFHIGSTSVPGLKAKPIIDILLVVEDLNRLDAFSARFEALGYEVMGEFGILGRRYFRKGGNNRTHQIHAFHFENITDIERHLIFRDYLRIHPAVCQTYGALKSALAQQFPTDIDSYSDGKHDFVSKTEQDALRWYWAKR